jgi:subtilase family serine protease
MSDPAEKGAPCNYASTTDTLALAGGGTSFAAPAFAGIQALINQKAESSQGNPNYAYYRLASQQFAGSDAATCNSDLGTPTAPQAPAKSCVFYDVTAGDNDVPCAGTASCFGFSATDAGAEYGALSTSAASFSPAYSSGVGWDYATGLGSVNATNLVNAVANTVAPPPPTVVALGGRAPLLYGLLVAGGVGALPRRRCMRRRRGGGRRRYEAPVGPPGPTGCRP